MTQEKFAEQLGLSVEFISLVERGINAPSVDNLENFAACLGVEVRDLFSFDSPNSNNAVK
ncbi:MAG: helix-turn-helix transcriptional regulator [Bdellovibrionaceae bacterium]|nr:helix-turn-helix transcriptional regulator [Pseudobdellovibrionaceae bacterium]